MLEQTQEVKQDTIIIMTTSTTTSSSLEKMEEETRQQPKQPQEQQEQQARTQTTAGTTTTTKSEQQHRTKNKNNNSKKALNCLRSPKKGERKQAIKTAKAERKAARLRDEQAEIAKLAKLNATIGSQHQNGGRGEVVDYIAILDFEATCDDKTKLDVHEIIEFPTVFVSTKTGKVKFVFHTYVRPEVHPTLTAFCTELTGIEQATVEEQGMLLSEALESHQGFLKEHNLVPAFFLSDQEKEVTTKNAYTFMYATCGDWDLKTCLPNQLNHLKMPCPFPLTAWCNLKHAFQKLYRTKATGMTSMLRHLDLELEGRHHSGIDDCRNLARIVKKMLKDGWEPKAVTATTLR